MRLHSILLILAILFTANIASAQCSNGRCNVPTLAPPKPAVVEEDKTVFRIPVKLFIGKREVKPIRRCYRRWRCRRSCR